MQKIYYPLCWNFQVTPQQKSSGFSPFTPLNRRTPVSASNSEGKDPKNLKRRQGLDYLSRIPSPPPITPLKTRASPCVSNTFNPPRRSVTPKPPQNESPRASRPPPGEEKWVHDEELVMIDTQALLDGLREGWWEKHDSWWNTKCELRHKNKFQLSSDWELWVMQILFTLCWQRKQMACFCFLVTWFTGVLKL